MVDVPKITVVPGIIPSDKMTKCSLSVTPIESLAQLFRPIKLTNLLAQPVVQLRHVQLLYRIGALTLMHRHIEDAKMQLAQIEQGIVDVACLDDVVDERVRHLL